MKNLYKYALLGLLFPSLLLAGASKGHTQEAGPADPLTTQATELLDRAGVLARQSEMGEGLILLEHQLKHAQAIERLIDILGPDAMIEISPGEFRNFADTPAGIRAKIELDKLQKEYFDLQEPPIPQNEMRPPRYDATSSDIEEMIDRRISEMKKPSSEPVLKEEPQIPPISLREIYGSGPALRAVLQFGGDLFRVRSGDVLGRGVRVIDVEEGGVRIERLGQEFFLSIPG